MDVYHLTDELIKRAKNVNLEKFLPTKGFTFAKERGRRNNDHKVNELEGISVRRNYYINEIKAKSGDAIQFCMDESGMSFRYAVKVLNEFQDSLENKKSKIDNPFLDDYELDDDSVPF